MCSIEANQNLVWESEIITAVNEIEKIIQKKEDEKNNQLQIESHIQFEWEKEKKHLQETNDEKVSNVNHALDRLLSTFEEEEI